MIRYFFTFRLKKQLIDRSFLSQFSFAKADLVITIGPDGLVVNTSKYLHKQPILAVNIAEACLNNGQLDWNTDHLMYAVREPFPGKITGTDLVFGDITSQQPMTITSHMPENGVIFSDGIESDYLKFNVGSTVTIGIAEQQAHILVKH